MWFCNSFTTYHVDSSVTFKWHRCPLKPACDLGSEQWFTLKQLETTLEWLRDKFLTVAQPKQTKTLYDIWGCWQVTDLFCDWLIISFEFWQKSKTKAKLKKKPKTISVEQTNRKPGHTVPLLEREITTHKTFQGNLFMFRASERILANISEHWKPPNISTDLKNSISIWLFSKRAGAFFFNVVFIEEVWKTVSCPHPLQTRPLLTKIHKCSP